ncbi:MAG: hypothetical protein KDA61_10980, partial [Planctomycetales bacterium]|nr:hypothetical protein [Planctomycetales bacterium]
ADRVKVEGSVAAEMYQTYGVPPELFESLAAEHNLAFDWEGYRQAMEEHGEVSGKVQHTVMGAKGPIDSLKHALHSTEFVGYDVESCDAVVKGIISGTAPHEQLCDKIDDVHHEAPIRVVLDRTPFYGESGGQVGDVGILVGDDFEFEVTDTQKDGALFVHHGRLRRGILHEGAQVKAVVDASRRLGIRRAHSATHNLHFALQKNLGAHAQQQGSKVDNDWLRFDFTNLSPVDADQLTAIADDVAAQIAASQPIHWATLPLADAREQGAMMLFGEKYPDPVRMVSMGEFSKELCGGTHLDNTRDVAAFEIIAEEGVSAGTRRITALTGARAAQQQRSSSDQLEEAAALLGVSQNDVPQAVGALTQRCRELKRAFANGEEMPEAAAAPSGKKDAGPLESRDVKRLLGDVARQLSVAPLAVVDRVATLQQEEANLIQRFAQRADAGPLSADALLENAERLGEATLVVAELPDVEANLMRQLIDQIRQKTASSAVLLAAKNGDDKVTIVAGVTDDLQQRGAHAGKWLGPVAKVLGGGGGGRPDMAQAGGKQPEKLAEAFQTARQVIGEMLK